MNKKTENYGNDSIRALKGADRVRKRPGVIFGSDGLDGCKHCFFEILSNSIDEAREGYGNKIEVSLFDDGSIQIVDYGRGIPVDFNKFENKFNWELLFCELYAGGKYDNSSGQNYEYSLGLNGLGLCASQYASEYMDVEIYRDGKKFNLHFEHGENIGGLKSETTTVNKRGTRIKWKPDILVFTEIEIELDYFKSVLKRQAVVNKGLLFELKTADGENFEFFYENGIYDYVSELSGAEALSTIAVFNAEKEGRDRADHAPYKVKLSAAFAFSNKFKLIEHYHNSSWLEHGGAPAKALRQAFLASFHSYLNKTGKYNKNESKILFCDIEECLIFVSSSFSNQTSYENQTKKAITNKFIYEAGVDFLKHSLEVYFTEHPAEAEVVAKQILINKRSREKAEKTRLNLKKVLNSNLDVLNRIQKFVDCRSKDKNLKELYIVEGNSALGACKQSRDANFQAIIAVRGKILNCLKADYEKIFKNEIITDLIKVLGCGVEIKTKANKEFGAFNFDGLRFNKVVICTDADVDGFQIRTLILTMLFRLTPTLIEKGVIYIAMSPLYEIKTKKRTYFAYDEQEKAAVLAKLEKSGEKFEINRSKGLGENEPDMMWLTTMCPKTRRLVKVVSSKTSEAEEMFNLMLGDDLKGRKSFIEQNGAKYFDLADIY